MNVEVNLLAVLVAAVSSFVVGFIWYHEALFGKGWMKMVNMTEKKAQEGMAKAMGSNVVTALLMAYTVAMFAAISNGFFTDNTFLSNSVMTALWLWLGISATTIITHDSFEQRDMRLTAMNIGNQFVTLLAMGLIIGLVGL